MSNNDNANSHGATQPLQILNNRSGWRVLTMPACRSVRTYCARLIDKSLLTMRAFMCLCFSTTGTPWKPSQRDDQHGGNYSGILGIVDITLSNVVVDSRFIALPPLFKLVVDIRRGARGASFLRQFRDTHRSAPSSAHASSPFQGAPFRHWQRYPFCAGVKTA